MDSSTHTRMVAAQAESALGQEGSPQPGRVECPLTETELSVLSALSAGLSRQQAASELGITAQGLDSRLDSAAGKLGATTPMQAIAACIRSGWIAPVRKRDVSFSEDEVACATTAVPYGCPLTSIQLQTLRLVGEGLTYKEIAAKRGCSVSTVRSHVHLICSKLGVAKCAQAVLVAYKKGWLEEQADSQTSLQVRRLADVTEELVVYLQRRRKQMSPALYHYLASFDDMMLSQDEEERIRAREFMQASLARVLSEKGISPRKGRDHNAALTNLLDTLITRKLDAA